MANNVMQIVARSGEAILVAFGDMGAVIYPDGDAYLAPLAVLAGHGQWTASEDDLPESLAAVLTGRFSAFNPAAIPVTAASARKLTGEALEEFNRLHPRGFGGRFGHGHGTPSAGLSGRAAVEAGDFRGLKRVGGQRGSNPAALFEDEDGQRWYVKAQKSPEHANNEALASALYRKTYTITTPEVHTGSGAPGLGEGPQTASEWLDVEQPNFDDPIFQRDIKSSFATHAWLANWDAAGMGMDNVAVEKGTPFPVEIDVGGSLLFRAQGGAKGDLFGDSVTEFDTLRDPRYAPSASRLFGDMSAEELAQSAEWIEKITPKEIRALVAEHDMPPELGDRLIARQNDIVARGEQLRRDLEVQADPHEVTGRAALEAAGARLSDKPAAETYDEHAELTFKQDPGWKPATRAAAERSLRFYRNTTFRKVNAFLRGDPDAESTIRIKENIDAPETQEAIATHVAHMWDVFEHSRTDSPVLLFRGLQDGDKAFPGVWKADDSMVGTQWVEPSPVSTSADERVAKIFAVDAVMRLHVPAGVGAVQLSGWPTKVAHNREAEVLLQPRLRMRIVADHTEMKQVGPHEFGVRVFDVVAEVVPDDES